MRKNKFILNVFLSVIILFGCSDSDEQLPPDTIIPDDDEEEVVECPERDIDALVPSVDNFDWEFKFVETFDDADVSAHDTGIADNLERRRLYGPWKDALWSRRAGEEVDKIPYQWHGQVNHPAKADAISFHLENHAIVLTEPILSGTDDGYRVSFITDPIVNDVSSNNWISFMMDEDINKRGYVATTQFGFSIASNGDVKVYQNGNSKAVNGTVDATDEYNVILHITPKKLIAQINDQEVTAVLDENLPKEAFLFWGSDIDGDKVSWLDEIVVATKYNKDKSNLHYYGYYWVSGPFGENFDEISNYTNFNFIDEIKSSTPETQTNVIQVRWEFWSGADGNKLRSDWKARWAEKLKTIKDNRDKIRAVYLVDEPFYVVDISIEDYNMVLNQVRADLPDMPIMTVFAHPALEDIPDPRISKINCNIDWLGADMYPSSSEFYKVEKMNEVLMELQPQRDIFLIPQTYFSGAKTDEEVAEINWKYYNYALKNDRVIGIFNFGLWSHQDPGEVPLTMKAQRLMGDAIVNY